MDRVAMISEIKRHKDRNGVPYAYINISGGRVPLEQAPSSNLYAMFKRITAPKKENKQLEFNFAQ